VPAPGDLRIVQLFVNSLDIEEGTDEFASPEALSSWLYRHGLTAKQEEMSERDLRRARSFRELIRAMALANNGTAMAQATIGELESELARLRFGIRIERTGGLRFESSKSGLDEAIGRLVAIVSVEMIRGRWPRLKACARDACHWVFYDHSRNQAGTWCTMAICGARTKVQAYYRRRRGRPVRSS
jgi:predicted RNA-binding Zn ribbon-like protein